MASPVMDGWGRIAPRSVLLPGASMPAPGSCSRFIGGEGCVRPLTGLSIAFTSVGRAGRYDEPLKVRWKGAEGARQPSNRLLPRHQRCRHLTRCTHAAARDANAAVRRHWTEAQPAISPDDQQARRRRGARLRAARHRERASDEAGASSSPAAWRLARAPAWAWMRSSAPTPALITPIRDERDPTTPTWRPCNPLPLEKSHIA